MDKLPLNALRALAAVVGHGGLRPAARELGISHSALSRHLAQLEHWLGVPVTLRKPGQRDIVATPQGERLAEATSNALADIGRVVAAVRERRSPFSITISTTPSFAARWLLPRLPSLERAHPRLEISVMVDQRIEDPKNFAGDFAIRTGSGSWPGIEARPLMSDALYPVMSPRLWEASGKPRDIASLKRLRLLHDRDARSTWQLWREKHGPADLDVRAGSRFASSDLVLRAATQGMGVALAHHRLVEDDLESGVLMRPFGALEIPLGPTYWIAAPGGTALRAATKTVIAWLGREARSLPP